ncbi:MAG TPA: hypothetical protein VLT34_11160, partial [Arthrobacter sp.]|nr:hypothetical protein [Arthrobacter sp.]
VPLRGLIRHREDPVDAPLGLHPPGKQHVGRQNGGRTCAEQETPPGESLQLSGMLKHTGGTGITGAACILNFGLMGHISTVATGQP